MRRQLAFAKVQLPSLSMPYMPSAAESRISSRCSLLWASSRFRSPSSAVLSFTMSSREENRACSLSAMALRAVATSPISSFLRTSALRERSPDERRSAVRTRSSIGLIRTFAAFAHRIAASVTARTASRRENLMFRKIPAVKVLSGRAKRMIQSMPSLRYSLKWTM